MAALRKNIFLTGSAGSGKSQALRAILHLFSAQRVRTDVLALTGVAALNVGGKTVHTYAGWGVKAQEFPLSRLEKNAGREQNFRRLSSTDVLIIDEISMISSNTLTRLDRVMKAARHNKVPFGGAVVIVVGDFFQLPPVKPFERCVHCGKATKKSGCNPDEFTCAEHGIFRDEDKWAFCAHVWTECRFEHVDLREKFRQADPVFSGMLDRIRVGTPLSAHEDHLLRSCRTSPMADDSIRIFPLRYEVANENKAMFNKLAGDAVSFRCVDHFDWNKQLHPKLHDSWTRSLPCTSTSPFLAYSNEEGGRHSFEDVLSLKKDMPVLLVANLDIEAGLVNGGRGHVVGFEAPSPRRRRRGERFKSREWLIPGDHFIIKRKHSANSWIAQLTAYTQSFASRVEQSCQSIPTAQSRARSGRGGRNSRRMELTFSDAGTSCTRLGN